MRDWRALTDPQPLSILNNTIHIKRKASQLFYGLRGLDLGVANLSQNIARSATWCASPKNKSLSGGNVHRRLEYAQPENGHVVGLGDDNLFGVAVTERALHGHAIHVVNLQ